MAETLNESWEKEEKKFAECFKRQFLSVIPRKIRDITLGESDLLAVGIGSRDASLSSCTDLICPAPGSDGLIKKLPSGLYIVEGIKVGMIYVENAPRFRWFFQKPKSMEDRTIVSLYLPKSCSAFEKKYSPIYEMIPLGGLLC